MKHPNNKNIINVQLTEQQAASFRRMVRASGLNVSDALRAILIPIINRYENEIQAAERDAASKILGEHE